MLFPSRAQWRSWSLPSKFSAIGVLLGVISLIIMILLSLVPYFTQTVKTQIIDDTRKLNVKQITVPIRIRNALGFDVHVDPGLQYFLLSPKTPLTDAQVESGIVRLEQPFGTTAINGNYAIAPYDEMITQFTLPRSSTINAAFANGGYKLRVVVTNRWVDNYSESIDVLFDKKTVSSGIRLTFHKNRIR